ncbi:MAG: hypothetical protein ACR2RB_00570 [Gammaproteobacteria bacterium]
MSVGKLYKMRIGANIQGLNTALNVWFFLALLSLALGSAFALYLGIARSPLADASASFYHYLVGHVFMVLVSWLLTASIFVWFRAVDTQQTLPLAGLLFIAIGLIAYSVVAETGTPYMNNYVPVVQNRVFFLGAAMFFAVIATVIIGLSASIPRYWLSSDNFEVAIAVSLMVACIMIGAQFISFIAQPFEYDSWVTYERLFWSAGHVQQVLNGTMFVVIWYGLLHGAGIVVRHNFLHKLANLVLIFAALVFAVAGLFIDPASHSARVVSGVTYGISLGIPILIHAYYVLKNLPADPIRRNAILFSMAIFFLGIAIAYIGLDNDTRVPAHYHGTVASLTLVMMGYMYCYLLDSCPIKVSTDWICRQLKLFGFGIVLLMSGLYAAGLFGAPRKVPTTSFTDSPVAHFFLYMLGIGTVLAVTGVAMFLFLVIRVLLRSTYGPVRTRQAL